MLIKAMLILLVLLLAGCKENSGQIQTPAPTPASAQIERIVIASDEDGDGILGLDDIVEGARKMY